MPRVKNSRVIVIEIDAKHRGTGAMETFYVSDWAYRTQASDTPALKQCLPLITSLPVYARYVQGAGRILGADATPGQASITLGNTGRIDSWRTDYQFAGYGVRIYTLSNSKTAYSTRTLWLSAIQRPHTWTLDELTIPLGDRESRLMRPVNTGRYTGAGGVLGGATIAGQTIPLGFGMSYGVTGTLVDETFLIFQLHNGPFQALIETYDGGYASAYNSAVADYANFSALRAAVLASADTATCRASGYVRLGNAPTYGVTFDFQGDATGSYTDTISGLVQRLLITFGPFSAGDLASTAVSTLDAISTATLGRYIPGGTEVDVIEVLDDLLSSVGAFRYFERTTGKMQFGQLVVPTTAMVTGAINEWAQDQQMALRPPAGAEAGIPPTGVRVRYRPNWTPLTDNFAPQTTPAERVRQQLDWQQVYHPLASTIADLYPDAKPMTVENNYLVSAAQASAFAAWVGTIIGFEPDFWDVPVPSSKFTTIEVGQVWSLRLSRFDYTNGQPLFVTGVMEDLNSDTTYLQLWG